VERRRSIEQSLGYIELHIEQGPVLESSGVDIGIVESIAAPIRMRLNLTGHSDHSGACPMNLRHDALAAAAGVILETERLGRAEIEHKSVATVGTIRVPHQALNVVPGACELAVDIRGIDRSSMDRICDGLRGYCRESERERGVRIEETLLSDENPVAMDARLSDIIRQNCEKTGLTCMTMPSGAGHDAMNMAKLLPAAMIFVPCVGGVSHNNREEVLEKDMRNAIQIMYEVVTDICSREEVLS